MHAPRRPEEKSTKETVTGTTEHLIFIYQAAERWIPHLTQPLEQRNVGALAVLSHLNFKFKSQERRWKKGSMVDPLVGWTFGWKGLTVGRSIPWLASGFAGQVRRVDTWVSKVDLLGVKWKVKATKNFVDRRCGGDIERLKFTNNVRGVSASDVVLEVTDDVGLGLCCATLDRTKAVEEDEGEEEGEAMEDCSRSLMAIAIAGGSTIGGVDPRVSRVGSTTGEGVPLIGELNHWLGSMVDPLAGWTFGWKGLIVGRSIPWLASGSLARLVVSDAPMVDEMAGELNPGGQMKMRSRDRAMGRGRDKKISDESKSGSESCRRHDGLNTPLWGCADVVSGSVCRYPGRWCGSDIERLKFTDCVGEVSDLVLEVTNVVGVGLCCPTLDRTKGMSSTKNRVEVQVKPPWIKGQEETTIVMSIVDNYKIIHGQSNDIIC
eukprot:Gb_11838 [translate_table: standard]